MTRALTAHTPPPGARLSEAQRAVVGRAAAAEEPRWRTDSLHRFPGDSWSQDDDVHASERSWAVGEARRRGVDVGDVFRAIDGDLRAHPPATPRKANASPSKPRPFYD
ncbi:MAG: hypothetical protein L0Y66_04960 [Myxococcaceae bacterium]|nr:hypothetical protein [Myxococcaceae bacterium]MCI0672668.1 hypothetical protein [Myxococcaceae bacterium]